MKIKNGFNKAWNWTKANLTAISIIILVIALSVLIYDCKMVDKARSGYETAKIAQSVDGDWCIFYGEDKAWEIKDCDEFEIKLTKDWQEQFTD